MSKTSHHFSISNRLVDFLSYPKGKITDGFTRLFYYFLRLLVNLKLFPVSKAKYLPAVGCFKIKFPQQFSIKMEVTAHDEIARTLFWEGIAEFEYETVRLFIELSGSAQTVFDIGANNGYFGLIAAQLNPTAQVFAFEPVPGIYRQIRRNVAFNQLKNLTVIQAAVSEKDGRATLFVPRNEFPTSASLMESFRSETEPIDCQTITLDNFIRENHIDNVDLVKIDTEATEPSVLKGMQMILNEFHPDIICEVLKGRTEERLQTLLEPLNYNFYWITAQGLKKVNVISGDPSYQFKNYLFTTKQF